MFRDRMRKRSAKPNLLNIRQPGVIIQILVDTTKVPAFLLVPATVLGLPLLAPSLMRIPPTFPRSGGFTTSWWPGEEVGVGWTARVVFGDPDCGESVADAPRGISTRLTVASSFSTSPATLASIFALFTYRQMNCGEGGNDPNLPKLFL